MGSQGTVSSGWCHCCPPCVYSPDDTTELSLGAACLRAAFVGGSPLPECGLSFLFKCGVSSHVDREF